MLPTALQPRRRLSRAGAVGKYHPVVAAFRDATDRLEVTRSQLPRVLRVCKALVIEAEATRIRRVDASQGVTSRVPQAGLVG